MCCSLTPPLTLVGLQGETGKQKIKLMGWDKTSLTQQQKRKYKQQQYNYDNNETIYNVRDTQCNHSPMWKNDVQTAPSQ